MNTQIQGLLLSITCALLLSPLLVKADSVSSLSREQFRQDSPDDIFWEVAVSCSGIREKRVIEQKADTEQWCSKEVKSLCDNDKLGAAERVCGASYRRELRAIQAAAPATQPAPSVEPEIVPRVTITPPSTPRSTIAPPVAASVTSALQNESAPAANQITQVSSPQPENDRSRALISEIEIEEQRIAIEQEKLDLRRRELQLKKRELSILQTGTN